MVTAVGFTLILQYCGVVAEVAAALVTALSFLFVLLLFHIEVLSFLFSLFHFPPILY